jgi:hypothetical protein
MKKLIFILLLLLLVPQVAMAQSQPWCSLNEAYFQHNASTTPVGYEELINYPSGNAEVIETVSVINTGGPVLIDNYIMPIGSLASADALEPGLRRYRIYAYVSSNVGVTQLNFTAFQRFANGTEQNFYTALSGDIDALTVSEYDFNYVSQNALPLSSTDRLGVRVSANTTHSAPITVYWVYQGSTHASMFVTGFFSCPSSPTGGVESYAYSPSSATPLSGWIVVAITAISLFVLAFYFKLRDENGEISKERIIFSIVSTAVSGIAAYLSLEIIIPSGTAISVVYQEPVIAILFAITSIISFANLVYCIMQPEVLKPDNNDYKNNGGNE